MTEDHAHLRSVNDGLTVAPSLDSLLETSDVPANPVLLDRRTILISGYAIILGVLATLAGQVLVKLINAITNLSFYGRFSLAPISPAGNSTGLGVLVIPMIGAIVVGLMARFGSKAIRGHGIPEAMEQILSNRSRIPARITFLKPISAAVAIGTGGPFGAEGPIIATGGAIGSVLGQLLRTSPEERKTLLAAGAAAGMSAIFGSPMAAVLLAIELLLFEFRPRSLIPVAIACCVAGGMRHLFEEAGPVFPMPDVAQPGLAALACYFVLGAVAGVVAVTVTRAIYGIEDAFERLPIHWMWWPLIGALAVGMMGYFVPRTLGVGYENITDLLSNRLSLSFVAILVVAKFVSWSISLGSGTSGGTLAPLMTIGSGLGALVGSGLAALFPGAGIDIRVAALVGMAALFAGASRAVLASAVFAFETTRQPKGLLPLLAGCITSYFVSCLLMRTTLMTEKISRRGLRAPSEYVSDLWNQFGVSDVMARTVVTLPVAMSVKDALAWFATTSPDSHHQGYPLVNQEGVLCGVLTRRDLLSSQAEPTTPLERLITRSVKYVYDDCSVRQAAEHMINHNIGRLPVVSRSNPKALVGIVTRSDLLTVFRRGMEESRPENPHLKLWGRVAARSSSPSA